MPWKCYFFFKEKKTTPCVTCTQSCCYVFIAQHHYRKSLTVFILLSMPWSALIKTLSSTCIGSICPMHRDFLLLLNLNHFGFVRTHGVYWAISHHRFLWWNMRSYDSSWAHQTNDPEHSPFHISAKNIWIFFLKCHDKTCHGM